MHYRKSIEAEPAMPTSPIEVESTLTDRYQTTVPDAVRRVLRLGKRDKLRYAIGPGGEVVLSKATEAPEDPAVLGFLEFLARDLADHPERVQALDPALAHRIGELTRGAVLDLDAPLQAEDE